MRMIVKIIFPALAFLGGFAVAPGFLSGSTCGVLPAAHAAKGVLYDRETILREFFPGADRIDVEQVTLTPDLAARIKARIGYSPAAPAYSVYVGRKAGADLGYAVIDDEKGMHEPITFAVLVGLDGAVQRQEVMVYREPEGDGVTCKRFARQFTGKTMKDPIRAGVDITVVSSATISSNSLAVGVRRAVAVIGEGILAAPVGSNPLVPASAALRSLDTTGRGTASAAGSGS